MTDPAQSRTPGDGPGAPLPSPSTGTERLLRPPSRRVALVAVGGAIGAVARTVQSTAFPPATGQLPWTTLAENVAGAFLLAWLLTVLTERIAPAPWLRPMLATGLLGAYTTYATVGLELHLLVHEGDVAQAVLYLGATTVLGMLAGGAGIVLGRRGHGGSVR